MPALYLTFDDGPHPVWTSALLRALSAARARATFFVLARSAHARPDLLRAMADAGHAVGLHGTAHLRHTSSSREAVERDTALGLELLAAAGVEPVRWRTPWGALAPWSREVAQHHRLTLTGWDADSHDWRGDRAAAMARVLRPGAVVLCHDGHGPGALRAGARETVRFVALAARWARERGVALEALPLPGEEPPGFAVPAGHPDATPAMAA